MTPADTLRRAAALMRERALPATPGRWALDGPFWHPGVSAGPDRTAVARIAWGGRGHDAQHIASWDRPPALAVADCLERGAKSMEEDTIWDTPDCPNCGEGCPGHPAALFCDRCGGAVESTDYPEDLCQCWADLMTIARAYLREDQP